MPVEPMIEIDKGSLQKNLDRLAKKAGVTVQFVCWDQLRLWTQDMMRKTPPRKLSQGRLTISAGVAELFEPAETPIARDYWKSRLQEQGSTLVQYTKRGKMRIKATQLKVQSALQMQRIHAKARTSKGGVSLRKVLKVDPSMAFSGKLIVAQSEYNRFLRMKQKNIGNLKAGWIPALQFWSRKTNATPSIPTWVMRHAERRGYPAGKIDKDGNGFVAAVNSVIYANNRISQDRLVEITQGARQRDLVRGGFKRMADLTERFSKGAI